MVLEAGSELTLNAGGSFLKLDGSGVTIVGPTVRMNAGGSPGRGSGQAVESPLLPGHAVPETSEDVTLKAPAALLKQEYALHEAAQVGDGVCEVCEAAKGDS
ncbi:hypothetical protein L861_05080 [Litchfieldella anticariensis FP35 = DSM 16096]|uniref:DUF2345 domain-containing protein n=1 Tax=Litchfieldella anticariensis (strain DSM 16096 / CECT 5854 / CIP 108499 / LMG 22089 / FP35) TaxID=1121939 RepID=S2KLU5_LITA3|nr:hypothetical protein L861_05080 [Halomonas anticariensis FP35 = DSM 16096]